MLDGIHIQSGSGAAQTSGSFTITAAFATPGTSSWAYTIQAGLWTRIGSIVAVSMAFSGTPTIGTGSGIVTFSGFPFNAAIITTLAQGHMGSAFATWPTGTTHAYGSMINGGGNFTINCMGPGVGPASIQASHMTSGAAHTFRMSGIVIVS